MRRLITGAVGVCVDDDEPRHRRRAPPGFRYAAASAEQSELRPSRYGDDGDAGARPLRAMR